MIEYAPLFHQAAPCPLNAIWNFETASNQLIKNGVFFDELLWQGVGCLEPGGHIHEIRHRPTRQIIYGVRIVAQIFDDQAS